MNSENEIRNFIAESQIMKKLHLYARGCDRGDLEIMKSIYHPDAQEEHGIFSGNGHDFCDFVVSFVATVDSVTHYITNAIIEVDGNIAHSESSFFVATIGISDENGEKIDLLMGGRYFDRFERREADWKIAHRQVSFDWYTRAPKSSSWDDPLVQQWTMRGRKDKQDHVYRFLEERSVGARMGTLPPEQN
ncbi:nuclear transport factor 2 family protein [Sphingosinicella xenopeptidilytica]|uniref:Nuclear transport factor 2 family protein n=1 Tax=Sphingosinicella xenopeptidilytica TaxID=364098 RepID=A0ABW3C128_SPHXN